MDRMSLRFGIANKSFGVKFGVIYRGALPIANGLFPIEWKPVASVVGVSTC
jgi:hypothetical protein